MWARILSALAVLGNLFGWLKAREERKDVDDAKQAGATDASNQTQIVISDIAAARADLPPAPTDPRVLADSLRARAAADRARSGDLGAGARDQKADR